MTLAFVPHEWPGRLIVFEGIKRAGKSTAIRMLQERLAAAGRTVVATEWNSVPEIHTLIQRKKQEMSFTPLTWCLLHVADFALRYEEVIVPALKAGAFVIADRYVYTALTRDVFRGVPEAYVEDCYRFAVQPDLTFYFHVPVEVALQRLHLIGDVHPHNAGRDIWPAIPLDEGFLKYQGGLHQRYLRLAERYPMELVDGTQPQEAVVGQVVRRVFAHFDIAAQW